MLPELLIALKDTCHCYVNIYVETEYLLANKLKSDR